MNGRKREKPYYSRHAPYSLPKRRRPLPLDAAPPDDADTSFKSSTAAKVPTSVVVIGVPAECSVLDLKSRFEMYGPISRTRMEPDGVAYINFRSNEAAQSAVDAARDSSFPVTIQSTPVQVMWASDPVPKWEGGAGRKDGLSSKLVRPEVPLSRHGRGNKLGSAIVNPRDENNANKNLSGDSNNDNDLNSAAAIGSSGIGVPFRGREIVAYDDIL
ncbi:hypothetical protein C2S52_020593 [Perilla frutescens var. hirtella]|uniref:RRM domain-containing protein n=1 Tax=Perilla frutescens var. hirtella TaxID=608512 RepID=A0AAD4IVV9_PERFH|nr:hypothetical protein C2S52_020593 [Perilla frutescens var. hirtella]KAH6805269.1 hypothetical protein C2S51_030100 [Perilla frutescens var. frutescens]KAH6822352.1 hypothetical protein C2S53_003817 [Perilla frutescens var. hirtella]